MKKSLVKLLLIAGFMSFAVAFASVDDFKNNVFKIDLYKTADNSVNAVIYTTVPYSLPINVIKKSDTEYVILMPEVKSSLVQTPNLKLVGDLVEKLEIKTQPYSLTPPLNGYTKFSFTTLKPISITTSLQVLKIPEIQNNSVNAFLEKLDKKTEAPTPVIVAKPTELSKPKAESVKMEVTKAPVVKPVVVSKSTSPVKIAKKQSVQRIAQPIQKKSTPMPRVAKAVTTVKPVKKIQPTPPKPVQKIQQVQPVQPKPVQKVESPVVQPEPQAPPEPVVEETTPVVEEESTVVAEEAPPEVEETSADEEYVEEEYTEEPQPNNWGNILLIIGIVFGVGTLAFVFLWYAKKLKKEVEIQANSNNREVASEFVQEYQQSVSESFKSEFKTPEDIQPEFEPTQDFTAGFTADDFIQESELVAGIVSDKAINEQEDVMKDFSQSDFELSAIEESDFIIEEPEAPLTKEDIHQMYNEGFEEIVPEIVEDVTDEDFIIEENDWGEEFGVTTELEQPKKSIDELFSGAEEEVVVETVEQQLQLEASTESNSEPIIQQVDVPSPPEIEPEPPIEAPQSVSENNLGFDIKSSFKIDDTKAMHLIELDGKTSLIGTMDDEVFVLKTFNTLVDNPIQSRLYENMTDKNVYMVKAGKFKGLIDVSKKAMELAVEL